MASLRDIRKRITSVKNTQKITGAMKMVAASKLRHSQEQMLSARPYSHQLGALLHRVATRSDDGEEAAHPLLAERKPRRALLLVVTSDRGLCGAFNANILRRAEAFVAEHSEDFENLEIATIGRKAIEYFKKRNVVSVRSFPGVFEDLTYRRATEISEGIAQEFVDSELDAVYLLYNEFKSVISQKIIVEPLLPIVHAELPEGENVEYIYEPTESEVLNHLVPRYVATLIWQALLESSAAEHGARMTAMDAATTNARELVDSLSLQYNRARQAAITTDLMDIVGGAEALNG